MRNISKTFRIWFFLLILSMLMGIFPGCTSSEEEEDSISEDSDVCSVGVFFTNETYTSLIERKVLLTDSSSAEEKVSKLMEAMQNPPEGLYSIFPEGVTTSWNIERAVSETPTEEQSWTSSVSNNLAIRVSDSYRQLTPNCENVFRVGLMKTMIRVPEINTVALYLGQEMNIENRISFLSGDTVIVNESDENFFKDTVAVKLYFLNEDGDALVPETRTFSVMMSELLSEKIMENLLMGPQDEKLRSALPVDTVVNDIIVQNDICYLDLKESFVTNMLGGELSENLTIYSIVNSLTQGSITSVQFLIDGQTREYYKSAVKINVPLTYNDEYVKK